MSQRNGDRSRFQINRKRKLRHRERLRALLNAASAREGAASAGEPRPDAKATKRGQDETRKMMTGVDQSRAGKSVKDTKSEMNK